MVDGWWAVGAARARNRQLSVQAAEATNAVRAKGGGGAAPLPEELRRAGDGSPALLTRSKLDVHEYKKLLMLRLIKQVVGAKIEKRLKIP